MGRASGLALAALLVAGMAQEARAEWFHEDFTVHGFFTSKMYFRSPNLDIGENIQMSSWRSELNLEMEMGLYRDENLEIGLVGIVRPIYEGVYDLYPNVWGDRVKNGEFGSGAFAAASNMGASCDSMIPGVTCGTRIDNEYTVVNNDTGTLFTGHEEPTFYEDQIVFYGGVQVPIAPRGTRQRKIGGAASATDFQFAADRLSAAGDPSLQNTLNATAMGVGGGAGLNPLFVPLNAYAKARGDGDRGTFEQAPVDINRTSSELQFDCLDNAHPWCMVRELYADIEFGRNTFIRLGKQQIVWGKTDAFRLQDIINPLDIGYHNVFPDLEERRIPQLAMRVIQSLGDLGPLQDSSLEFVWNLDKFLPAQVGQCGEPYAFTAACHLRADANGHTLLNLGTADVEDIEWNPFQNGEFGLRFEFRVPDPSMAVSFSAYWGYQDTPVARFENYYGTSNPNPAIMAFLQGLGLGPLIDNLEDGVPGNSVWSSGFDLLDRSGFDGTPNTAAPSLFEANQDLIAAWNTVANTPAFGCDVTSGRAKAQCISNSGLQILNFPWSGSEDVLEYPRVLTLGGSVDYQIPGADTILRLEVAYDIGRQINNTDELDMVSETDVFKASIGLDRPTFIPFLNANRTAFLSFQTFVEHVIDYDDGAGNGFGMVVPQTQLISTAFMQNYWRNDSLVLTNFVAFDWDAQAWITGPTFRWILNQNVFFDVGVNLIWGKPDTHNLSNLCGIDSQSLSCVGDPTTWQPGQWQGINQGFAFKSEVPWWKESFGDKFMEQRDEIWVGFTYQF